MLGRGKEGFSSVGFREHGPADTLMSDFSLPQQRENTFLLVFGVLFFFSLNKNLLSHTRGRQKSKISMPADSVSGESSLTGL